jgi:uncharacterized protein (DUF169 family)
LLKEEIMSQQISYSQLANRLSTSLKLRQAPVAVSFSDSVPAGMRAHEGRVPAGCRFWQDATRGAFVTSSADHDLCAIGIHTHNLQSSPALQTDLMDAFKVFADLSYVRPQDVAAIPVLKSQPAVVIYSPLTSCTATPGVVVLFVDASQTLLLSEATQQVESRNPPAMGRPACAVIPQVANTGGAALSLGCCGARAYLDVLTDDVAIFAIPGVKIEAYVQRIETLANANAVLAKFHHVRRRDVEAGQTPSVKESLAAMA